MSSDHHIQAAKDATMRKIMLALPKQHIAEFKALVESYDNLATFRTEDPLRHHVMLYFAPEAADDVEALVDSLAKRFEIRRVSQAGEA
jgi:uncharacterized protein DUF4911